jgi:hypothetical protein
MIPKDRSRFLSKFDEAVNAGCRAHPKQEFQRLCGGTDGFCGKPCMAPILHVDSYRIVLDRIVFGHIVFHQVALVICAARPTPTNRDASHYKRKPRLAKAPRVDRPRFVQKKGLGSKPASASLTDMGNGWLCASTHAGPSSPTHGASMLRKVIRMSPPTPADI